MYHFLLQNNIKIREEMLFIFLFCLSIDFNPSEQKKYFCGFGAAKE
jgi:hypothetical protein